MRLLRLAIFLSALFLSALNTYAEIYQYFDQDGTIIITNRGHSQAKKPNRPPAPKNIKLDYKEDVIYDYYAVTGKDFQELLHSATLNGPFDSNENKRYPGQTKWNLGWAYKYNYSYRIEEPYILISFNIFDIDFKSDITVILPAISEWAEIDLQDMKLWENYMQGLLSHEHDHVAIIKDSSYKDRALKEFSEIREVNLLYEPYSDIEAVIKKAIEDKTQEIGHNLIMTIKLKNDEYDSLTEHGLKPEMRKVFFTGQQ